MYRPSPAWSASPPSPAYSVGSYGYGVSPGRESPPRAPPPAPVLDTRNCQEKLFEFHAPTLPSEDDTSSAIPSFPLQLVDRHIPHSLILKHVEILPSLPNDISDGLDDYAAQLEALPEPTFVFHRRAHEDMGKFNARTIATLRRRSINIPGERIATNLFLRSKHDDGNILLMWLPLKAAAEHGLLGDAYATQTPSLQITSLPPEFGELEEDEKKTLTRLLEHSPSLKSAMYFCPEALHVLEDMSRLATLNVFPWQLDSRCSKVSPPSFCPPDAPKSFWNLPAAAHARRSSRLQLRLGHLPQRAPQAGRVHLIDRPGCTEEDYQPVAEHYIQKAWIDAVKTDSSMIVFDCGHFIRLGIRHRRLQTLFLSELIDIRHCSAPAYGRLWTAMHVASVYDALQRLPELETVAELKRKAAEPDNVPPPKRARSAFSEQRKIVLITQELIASTRAIALFFQFDGLDSPAPVLVFPPSTQPNPAYAPKDYISVVLEKRLGRGAVGEVFRAVIQPDGSSKKPRYCPFVVKMATTTSRIQRLRHEYKVYEHLNKVNVTGIPTVLGFRETANASMCVLLLSHVGRPLGARMNSDRKVKLTAKQSKELRSILRGIHGGGILHRDIRSWNILVDEFDHVYIADFDRGSFEGTEANFVEEKARLDSFIAGKYVDEDEVIGSDDLS
ncbi:hypothetical protein CPB85DRAFT_1255327 [Mucidula mucida]|nr:hypothetical protein CPB85DRAFT_1255327 [Mucidula mucida]